MAEDAREGDAERMALLRSTGVLAALAAWYSTQGVVAQFDLLEGADKQLYDALDAYLVAARATFGEDK